MDNHYWIGRKRASLTMARQAATSESRLFHYEMAGRYAIRAAHSPAFMLPLKGPATEDEREALQIPTPMPPHPGSFFRPAPPPSIDGPRTPGPERR